MKAFLSIFVADGIDIDWIILHFSKADSLIDVKLGKEMTMFNDEQFLNANGSILFTDVISDIWTKEEQFSNALWQIDFKEDGSFTCFKDWQFLNAFAFMQVKLEFGSTSTSVNDVHSSNEDSGIDVIVDGIIILVKLVQSIKHELLNSIPGWDNKIKITS